MAMLPISHITETPGDGIRYPWVIRCQMCGREVARVSQEELTAMVSVDKIDPVICFRCEEKNLMQGGGRPVLHTYNERAPWPTLRVPAALLGFI